MLVRQWSRELRSWSRHRTRRTRHRTEETAESTHQHGGPTARVSEKVTERLGVCSSASFHNAARPLMLDLPPKLQRSACVRRPGVHTHAFMHIGHCPE